MKKSITVLAATGLLLGLLVTFSPYKTKQVGKSLQFLYPESNSIQDTVTLQGTVQAAEVQRCYAKGSSRVLEIYVTEGEQVPAGHCLMKLERTEDVEGHDALMWSEELKTALLSGNLLEAEAVFEMLNITNSLQSNDCEVYYLYSKSDAIIMKVSVTEGEQVSSMLPCMELYSPESLQIEAAAGEDVVGLLAKEMECFVSVPAFEQVDLQGYVSSVAPYGQQTTRLTGQTLCETAVQIRLTDPLALKPGYRATAKVVVSLRENALLLPYEAIGQDDSGQEYVLKLQGSRVVRQPVETGSELETQVEIRSGITRGDAVLLQPDLSLEGALINLATH